MKKIYHLSNCTTCKRIIKELGIGKEFEEQNIKAESITAKQLDSIAEHVGSYEALFSRRAMKYKSLGLKNVKLTEADYRRLILEEYTFLKRPIIVINNAIFVGNSKKTIAAVAKHLSNQ